jgi:hypothetical protein
MGSQFQILQPNLPIRYFSACSQAVGLCEEVAFVRYLGPLTFYAHVLSHLWFASVRVEKWTLKRFYVPACCSWLKKVGGRSQTGSTSQGRPSRRYLVLQIPHIRSSGAVWGVQVRLEGGSIFQETPSVEEMRF